MAATDKDKYVEYLMHLSEHEQNGERESWKKESAQCERRIAELDAILKKLYEDRVFGVIPVERYASMSADYEAEVKKLKDRHLELQSMMQSVKEHSLNANDFANLVERYADITKLDAELLNVLIEKIVVHEKEEIDGETVMKLDSNCLDTLKTIRQNVENYASAFPSMATSR